MDRRYGFTLIEAMMAVTLSTMIVGVTYAALRMAGRASNASSRIATECYIMRAALQALIQEADTNGGTAVPAWFTSATNLSTIGARNLPDATLTSTAGPYPRKYELEIKDPITGVDAKLYLGVAGEK